MVSDLTSGVALANCLVAAPGTIGERILRSYTKKCNSVCGDSVRITCTEWRKVEPDIEESDLTIQIGEKERRLFSLRISGSDADDSFRIEGGFAKTFMQFQCVKDVPISVLVSQSLPEAFDVSLAQEIILAVFVRGDWISRRKSISSDPVLTADGVCEMPLDPLDCEGGHFIAGN